MSGRKKRFSDPHRLMAVICIVFYSALGLLALAWALLALFPALGETPVPLVMLVCALAAILAASILSALVRCPCCGAWLCRGMRLPLKLPHYCSNCGHPL